MIVCKLFSATSLWIAGVQSFSFGNSYSTAFLADNSGLLGQNLFVVLIILLIIDRFLGENLNEDSLQGIPALYPINDYANRVVRVFAIIPNHVHGFLANFRHN
ncbi:membrane or secreted protein [Beggiatoa sp. PS]|nr:membrane or secreted protein [Beggiatoa sp. PS]